MDSGIPRRNAEDLINKSFEAHIYFGSMYIRCKEGWNTYVFETPLKVWFLPEGTYDILTMTCTSIYANKNKQKHTTIRKLR